MWSASTESLSPRTLQYRLQQDSASLSWRQTLANRQHSLEFRHYFNDLLAQAPFNAYRWETPPLAKRALDQPFEFVLLNDPGLQRPADAQAFAEQWRDPHGSIATFANLRGDAVLIVPHPEVEHGTYVHLASFVPHAMPAQSQALWQTVGEVAASRLRDTPLWLSTAGAGVAWLHVRLDSQPKYYHHTPYRQFG